MVCGHSDVSGVLLRTLFVLRPGIARFAWTHAQLISEGLTSEAARRHHNYWHLLWSAREGSSAFVDPGGQKLASYPTLRFACERYLLRLEAHFPVAYTAEAIVEFSEGLQGWAEPEQLARLYAHLWSLDG